MEAKAFQYAIKLLGYRQRSRKELKDRLWRKGFPHEEIESALERLEKLDYINDSETARVLRDQAERVKLLGRSGARQFMRLRGIGKEDAENALCGYNEEDAALKLLERKSRALEGLPRHVARRRLAGYLGRRGYSGDSLYKMLRIAFDNNETSED
jgi:regulatory protein